MTRLLLLTNAGIPDGCNACKMTHCQQTKCESSCNFRNGHYALACNHLQCTSKGYRPGTLYASALAELCQRHACRPAALIEVRMNCDNWHQQCKCGLACLQGNRTTSNLHVSRDLFGFGYYKAYSTRATAGPLSCQCAHDRSTYGLFFITAERKRQLKSSCG
jgi:hypothetical protein